MVIALQESTNVWYKDSKFKHLDFCYSKNSIFLDVTLFTSECDMLVNNNDKDFKPVCGTMNTYFTKEKDSAIYLSRLCKLPMGLSSL